MVAARDELERALASSGVAQVRVAGGSMSPTVELGASVRVMRRAPRVGDVVLLASPGGYTLHRLVARLGPRFVHAGDAPRSEGGLCRAGDVLAVAELPSRTPPLALRARAIASALAGLIIR